MPEDGGGGKKEWGVKSLMGAGHRWACNPSYSAGGDLEDPDLKPAQANSSQDPISKKPFAKND
jgi:hypothetical protein